MLSSLHIENVAVIKTLDVDLENGFSALTGETGAGKSIIIDSINMLIGGRIQRELIRTGETKALVSGVFTSLSPLVLGKLEELGLTPDEDGCIMLQKSITDDGRSSVKLNGRTITASVHRELSSALINIHGQNDSQLFLNKASHIDLLDCFAETGSELDSYGSIYEEYTDIKKKLAELESGDKEKNRLIEIYRYQISEIDALKLREGEEEVLEAECNKLRNLENIKKHSSFAYRILHSSEKSASVTYLLDRASQSMDAIADTVAEAADISEKLRNYRYEIEDIALTIDGFTSDGLSDGDPTARLDKIEGRLDAIAKLKRKYGSSITEILAFRDEVAEKLDMIEQSDDKIAEYKEALILVTEKLKNAAEVLRKKRKSVAAALADRIGEVLVFLDMPKVRFEVNISPSEPRKNGFDDVEFLVSTNVGEPLKPMIKIASGGELSRIMLAMKSVLADKDSVDTLIFDEIDTGISGKTSRKVGIKLKLIADGIQVICVTHSAQIASLADSHFRIDKTEQDGRAFTSLTLLDDEGRVEETARILGGINVTETQRSAAREMIREGEELR
ncbi:MAG: DNA repair protein RecN [Ruminococcaceae bacterium]|nr:DNA repair protein RecN [Oscillospiraceae bacterium]